MMLNPLPSHWPPLVIGYQSSVIGVFFLMTDD
jgi:hypothetical protein